jgi:hypothetical protein
MGSRSCIEASEAMESPFLVQAFSVMKNQRKVNCHQHASMKDGVIKGQINAGKKGAE